MQTLAKNDGRGHRYPPPTILPVNEEDVHTISVFDFDVTASSPLHAYFHPTPIDRLNAIKSSENMLLAALKNPAFKLMKAIDPETGEIASFAAWEWVIKSGSEARKEEQDPPMQNRDPQTSPDQTPPNSGSGTEKTQKPKNFMAYVNSQTVEFRNSWFRDANYIELKRISTSPRFQRKGYATALLEWGHARADAEGRIEILLGSPVGRYLYANSGWKEIGQVVVDLKEWIEGAERGDLGWGVWKMYHMIRLPKAV